MVIDMFFELEKQNLAQNQLVHAMQLMLVSPSGYRDFPSSSTHGSDVVSVGAQTEDSIEPNQASTSTFEYPDSLRQKDREAAYALYRDSDIDFEVEIK